MLDKLKEIFSGFNFISPADFISLATAARVTSVKKGEILFQEGDLHYYGYFVIRGLLRSYVINEEGKDVTILFVPEKQKVAPLETFLFDKPSEECLEALEDTTVIRIDHRKMNAFASKNPRFVKLRLAMVEESLAEAVARIKFHTVLSPEGKYRAFKKEFPKLEERVKQKHLSSYLGITPQSLSRIRGRMEE